MSEHPPRYRVTRRCSLVRNARACQRKAEYRLALNEGDEADFCAWCLGYIVGLAISKMEGKS